MMLWDKCFSDECLTNLRHFNAEMSQECNSTFIHHQDFSISKRK